MPSPSAEPRQTHKRWYGLVRPVDDPIWQTIMPPNGYGCLCWVKQLTHSQAIKKGISKPQSIETIEHVNKRTGEIESQPKDITPSFAHNHDRLTALIKLAKDKHGTAFSKQLKKQVSELMLDLVASPNFNHLVPTVVGDEFATRFLEIQQWVNNEIIKTMVRQNIDIKLMDKRKYREPVVKPLLTQYRKNGKNDYWVVSILNKELQEKLQVKTNLIRLSVDIIITILK